MGHGRSPSRQPRRLSILPSIPRRAPSRQPKVPQPPPEHPQAPPVQAARAPQPPPEYPQARPVQAAQVPQPPPEHPQAPPVQAARAPQPPPEHPQDPRIQQELVDEAQAQVTTQKTSDNPTVAQDTPLQDGGETAAVPQSTITEIGAASMEREEPTDKAREQLRTIQSVRSEVAAIRTRARQVMDEAETFQEEAERVMAQARNTFAKALALNPEALKSMGVTITTLEEAVRTRRRLRHVTRQQAEEEAEGSRQRATDAVLNAVGTVHSAGSHVSRELEESQRIAATAESLNESSQEDLKHVRSIMSVAETHMRQEARRLLDDPSSGRASPLRETVAPLLPEVEMAPHYPSENESAPEAQPEVAPSLDATVIGPAPGADPPSQPVLDDTPSDHPNLQEIVEETIRGIPGRREQQPVGQDRPQFGSTDDLESALNAFLRSMENVEASPTREEEPEPGQIPSAGLMLDNLDFSREEPVGPESQQPPGGEVTPALSAEDAVEAHDRFSDDLLAQLQESLASASPVDESTGIPPAQSVEDAVGYLESLLGPESQLPPGGEVAPAQSVEDTVGYLESLLGPESQLPPGGEVAPAQSVEDTVGYLESLLGPESQLPPGGEVAPAQSVEDAVRSPESPPTEADERFSDDLLAHLQESLANNSPVDESTGIPPASLMNTPSDRPQVVPSDFIQPGSSEAPRAPDSPPSIPLAESYSGILHIIFTPAADAATLSFFWDVIETVAVGGMVIAQIPLADGSGHEFTLDMGADALVIQQLRARIPGAEIMALGPDRLSIQLAPMAE